MKKIVVLLLIGISTSAIISCEKNNAGNNDAKTPPQICFQYEYLNMAWGYQHSGWLMDTAGNVYCYNNPENWTFYDSTDSISKASVDSNIAQTGAVCYTIDKDVLAGKIELISLAAEGELSDPVNEMADAGVITFYGFLYNDTTKTYKSILLKQIGDYRINNSAPESVELYEWLDSVNYHIQKTEE